MAFILLAFSRQFSRTGLSLIGAGLLALSVADSGFAYLAMNDAYASGNLIDSAWFGGFLLITLGASWIEPAGPVEAPRAPLWTGLPYVPFGISLVASIGMHIARGSLDTVLYVLMVVIVGLVVVRQVLTLRDNQQLNRRLTASVAELTSQEKQLRHLAFHDPLTGLANRALFVNRMEHALVASPCEQLGVIFIDLDGFKQVNDDLGHGVGDQLLTAVAARLDGDVAARGRRQVERHDGRRAAIERERRGGHSTVAQREQERSEKLVTAGAIAARDLDVAKNSVTGAEAQVAEAKARLVTATKQLGDAVIHSPIDGVVSRRSVNRGDVVSTGTELFVVIDPSSMRLEASVPSESLSELKIGATVDFEVRGYSQRFQGAEDNGGVHTNSAIPNQVFYLAIEGGTNRTSGLSVQGVGGANRDQIEKAFYRAFTQMLPSNATFHTARTATIQSARDLYGAGSPAETAVTQAWNALGVN